MQEFDPRRPTLRLAPRLLMGVIGFSALALGWRLTAAEATATAYDVAIEDVLALPFFDISTLANVVTPTGFVYEVAGWPTEKALASAHRFDFRYIEYAAYHDGDPTLMSAEKRRRSRTP
ncbi:MAG TPA: hypothetical protein PK913_09005 [Phenylobacterium sp.]|nr:hypothetical protein [Phenylobacterium sp.]